MTTYLYCLLSPSEDRGVPSGLTGIGDAPVRSLQHGARSPKIEAWVATIDPTLLKQPAALMAQNALLHHAVVDAALATGRTPLPARFGQRFPDDEACLAGITARANAIHAGLARVDGLVEMAVLLAPSTRRVLRELQPATPHGIRSNESHAGRRYLEALRADVRGQERRNALISAVVERVSAEVSMFARAERRRQPDGRSSSALMASLAHLVSRADAEAYRLAVQRIEPPAEFQIVVAGPRAPYSFCDQDDDAAGMNLAD